VARRIIDAKKKKKTGSGSIGIAAGADASKAWAGGATSACCL